MSTGSDFPQETRPAFALRRPVWYGFLAGLCPLIPIPFVDDAVERWVRRRQVKEAFRRHRRDLSGSRLDHLLGGDERRVWLGCLKLVVVVPFLLLKKIFRKLVVFLTLRDCANRFTETFHEGFLVDRALERGWLAERARPQVNAADRSVRRAMVESLASVDSEPIFAIARRLFRGSRKMLVGASRRLYRLFRRRRSRPDLEPPERIDPVEVEGGEQVTGWVDRATAAVAGEAKYLEELDRRFVEAYEREAAANT